MVSGEYQEMSLENVKIYSVNPFMEQLNIKHIESPA